MSNLSATHGQDFAASSLFRASDADGDAITTYAFWNSGTGGGHFLRGGVALHANQEIDVTAAELSGVGYQPGYGGSGADTLWVRAYDGTQWSAWSDPFTVSPSVDTPPVVTVSNLSATHGQDFAASSLFRASDADGDAITTYAFWNSGTGGGHFLRGGVALHANQEIDVAAAELSGVGYQSGSGGSGADTLWVRAYDGTQWSAWSDPFTVSPSVDSPPVVTVSNLSATHGQEFAASSLFTASDADGDAITTYAFWNSGTGGGHFLRGGVALHANQEIDVTAAELSGVGYQPGYGGSGADTLWVRAYDGTQWSAWSDPFTVSPSVDTPPVVTVSNLSATHGQDFAASSLFRASDADGDAITTYAFWNSGTGGGHFLRGGVALHANQEIDVTAAELSGVGYQPGYGGSGADTLWVRAYDGTQWSPWSDPFTVSPSVDTPPVVTVSNLSATHGQDLRPHRCSRRATPTVMRSPHTPSGTAAQGAGISCAAA